MQRYRHRETETESEVQKRPEIHAQRETESGAPGTGAAHPGWERQPVPLAAARGPNSPFLRVAETLLLLSLRLESQRQLPAAAPDAQTKKIQTSFGLAHFQLRICPQE